MTEADTLQKTSMIWNYLADHPRESKSNAYAALHLEDDAAWCPLCEYVFQEVNTLDCVYCLLRDFWPNHCMDTGSPYRVWYHSDDLQERTIIARQIADAAQAKFNEIRGMK